MLALDGAQPPLVGEHRDQRPVQRAGEDLGAAPPAQLLGGLLVGEPGDRVVEPGQLDRRAELVGHPRGDHLELQRPDRRQHRRLVAAHVAAQHLHDALAAELLDAAPELLGAPVVLRARHHEVLGRERGDGREPDRGLRVEGVADGQPGRVGQPDHVARVGGVQRRAVAAEHRLRVLRRQRAPGRRVREGHAALEAARAHPDERQPVAVRPVHARLHLEHLAGERRVHRTLGPVRVGARGRGGRQPPHGLQQRPDAEVGQRRPEQHGRAHPGAEGVHVEDGADLVEQLQLLQGGPPGVALLAGRPLGGHPLLDRAGRAAGGAAEPGERAVRPADEAAEVARGADRPGQRGGAQPDALLDLVQQFERLASGPVPLVDERDHRDAAVPAHVEQLERLRLQALRRVEQHDGTVHGREHPVGVLGEVGVAGGVEQVQQRAAELEAQHRGGDRDAAGPLDVHPVGPDAAAPRLAVHGARLLDGRRVQRERLGQRRLPRVRMADHRERPPARRLGRDVPRRPRTAAQPRPLPVFSPAAPPARRWPPPAGVPPPRRRPSVAQGDGRTCARTARTASPAARGAGPARASPSPAAPNRAAMPGSPRWRLDLRAGSKV